MSGVWGAVAYLALAEGWIEIGLPDYAFRTSSFVAFSVVILLFSVLWCVLGYGLWRLRPWARRLGIVAAGIQALALVGELLLPLVIAAPEGFGESAAEVSRRVLLALMRSGTAGPLDSLSVANLVLIVWLVVYLSRQDVRSVFGSEHVPEAKG